MADDIYVAHEAKEQSFADQNMSTKDYHVGNGNKGDSKCIDNYD